MLTMRHPRRVLNLPQDENKVLQLHALRKSPLIPEDDRGTHHTSDMWVGRAQCPTHHCRRVGLPLTLSPDLTLDGFTDGQFAGTLANFCQVSSREAVGHLSQEIQVNILEKNTEERLFFTPHILK